MEFLKPYPTSAEGYRIELAKTGRLKEILTFFREHYHDDETLGKSLRKSAVDISDTESKLIEEDEDDMIVAVYESSPCLIAIHNETDVIVGVLLTVLSKRSDEDEGGAASAALFTSNNFKSTLSHVYYNYLAKIDREASIFNKYPSAKGALELFAIAVHKEHRQRGLAKDLTVLGIKMAKNVPGVDVVFGVYTSIYSKKVAEEVGMNSIMDFDLERDFMNADGVPVFPGTEPNNIVSVMALEIASE